MFRGQSGSLEIHRDIFRDSTLSHLRDQVQAVPDGDGSGQWRRHPRLPHEGRQHRHAQGRDHQQRGDCEDHAGAGRLPQLQRQQEPHAPLPQRHPGHGPRHHGDAAARPRHHRGPGPAGLAGGPPGQEYLQPGLDHFEKHTFQEIIQSIVQIISMQPFISEMAVEIGFNVSGLS